MSRRTLAPRSWNLSSWDLSYILSPQFLVMDHVQPGGTEGLHGAQMWQESGLGSSPPD